MAKNMTGKESSKASGAKKASKTVRVPFKPPEHPNVTLSDWLVVHANKTEVIKIISNDSTRWLISIEKA